MKELKGAIKLAAGGSEQSENEIELELIEYLARKYSGVSESIENRKIDALIKNGKHRIIAKLYN